nr:DUF3592 domain-containing protein [Ktedonobacter sp. SOSP1-52]
MAGICLLIALFLGALIYWLAASTWQVRLNGNQTRAIAHKYVYCEKTEDSPGSFSFKYDFTDTHGKKHSVANPNFCTNVFENGDEVTIWYMPDDPTSMITDAEAVVAYIITGVLGGLSLVALIISLIALLKPLLRPRQKIIYP